MTNEYRSIFLSDLHLGSTKCHALDLLKFLKENNALTIYLVGDVFDGIYERAWPKEHYQILYELYRKAKIDTRIIFIPGNHDADWRPHAGRYGNIVIARNFLHITKDRRQLLVTHGDETDMIRLHFILRWIVRVEKWTNWHLWEVLRKIIGRWLHVHTHKFEKKMQDLARDYDGVICGHIHHPRLRDDGLFFYMNCGDWTHHNSAIVETFEGGWELVHG